MNKAFIVSTDKGAVKDFVGEVLRYVEEQKNWSRGQARQYIGWSEMVQGETAIVAQPSEIDSTLFKDALKFAKTETKTDYKMARPDNYIGESRGAKMNRRTDDNAEIEAFVRSLSKELFANAEKRIVGPFYKYLAKLNDKGEYEKADALADAIEDYFTISSDNYMVGDPDRNGDDCCFNVYWNFTPDSVFHEYFVGPDLSDGEYSLVWDKAGAKNLLLLAPENLYDIHTKEVIDLRGLKRWVVSVFEEMNEMLGQMERKVKQNFNAWATSED